MAALARSDLRHFTDEEIGAIYAYLAQRAQRAAVKRNLSACEVLGLRRERPMTYKTAILVGSLRQESINRKVARSICAFASDHLDCAIVGIGNLALYNPDLDESSPEP